LLNGDQPVGHLRFSSQIIAFQQLSRSSDLAAVGSEDPVLGGQLDAIAQMREERQLK
jgi:hypothetical protein